MELSKGLIHFYIGTGKGKTTAAAGLAARIMGWQGRVLFCQFLKSIPSGEFAFFQNHSVECYRPPMRHAAFIWNQTSEEISDTAADLLSGWQYVREKIMADPYDLVVLDEMLDVVQCGFLPEEELMEFLKNRPQKTEVVLTGRDASLKLRELADYISLMNCCKHPYENGLNARKGIEF